MALFDVNGIALEIPDTLLSQPLRQALTDGHYESAESRAVALNLAPGDRVLELGAGAGYLSIQIARRVGAANLLAVEAHPDMAAMVQANLQRNGIAGTEVLEGAVVPDSHDAETIAFYPAPAYWASSLSPAEPTRGENSLAVPARRLGDLFRRHRPDVVILDIEGGEELLFDTGWPEHVRLVIVEIHPRRYPASAVRAIFDCLSASGLAYSANGSRGSVVVFERVTE